MPFTSLVEAAAEVLSAADPWRKAELTKRVVQEWRSGTLPIHPGTSNSTTCYAPSRPARSDDKVKVVAPGKAPKRGKGGSAASRLAIVHSLCHIESWAVDLAWDVIARWGADPEYVSVLPHAFYDDFVTVADDECRHFLALEQRLAQGYSSSYGTLAVHDGLWQSANETSHSLAARLAVEHCVHEARGLDVLPGTIAKFRDNGDEATAQLLEGTVYPEEITHCGAGVRWLTHLHTAALQATGSKDMTSSAWMEQARTFSTVEEWFHSLVRANFYGSLKPPFNESARAQAGFTQAWYLPLVRVSEAAAKACQDSTGVGNDNSADG